MSSKKIDSSIGIVTFLTGVGIILIGRYTFQKILHYPRIIFYTSWMLLFAGYLIYDLVRLRKEYSKKGHKGDSTVGYVIFKLIVCLFLSGWASFALLIPFNYYLIRSAKNNVIEMDSCKIIGIDARRNGAKIAREVVQFNFRNNNEEVDYLRPEIWELTRIRSYEKYAFKVIVQKSILGSYILVDDEIVGREVH